MNRAICLVLAVLLMGCLFMLRPASHKGLFPMAKVQANEGCSVETLRGSYGFYRTGINANGPLTAVGIAILDGKGNSSFRQTIRLNGVETEDLFTDGATDALYSVNPDCTGQLLNADGSGAFGHLVAVQDGSEAYFMSLTGTNNVYGIMKRIHSKSERPN